jgi:two-component system phosphate regulon response regulator PhoB
VAKILIVDDELANRLLVTTLLRNEGHEVLEAADGGTGLRLALEERPDLLIVDLSLPDVSGTELIRLVRGRGGAANVSIALYTASAIDAATRDFMDMHAIRHAIPKPSGPEDFLRAIDSALRDG